MDVHADTHSQFVLMLLLQLDDIRKDVGEREKQKIIERKIDGETFVFLPAYKQVTNLLMKYPR